MRTRPYLVMLQLMFAAILVTHLSHAESVARLQGIMVAVLCIVTVILLAVPRHQLTEAWLIAVVSLGATAVAVTTMRSATIEPWFTSALLLALAMASYAQSAPMISVFSGLVTGAYAVSLYRLGQLETEHALVLPVMLCLALVFVGKARVAQVETRRIADNEELARYRTMTDGLTGLPNREQFLERVARAIQQSRAGKDFQFAVFFIDLDGFKPINDRFGHKAGDAVLRQMAKRFQSCMRKGDVVARYGGDEFTLLVNHVFSEADAVRVAKRILAKLQEPIDVREPVRVGASIGIAFSTNLHERPEDLIRDADGAMYRAKSQGKNQYVFSDQTRDVPPEELKERLRRVAGARW
ncbi:MAG: GGDEF domain-containing protein [Nitrospira sp.]|nr:GGDEF domain-containing protein [Nitrospira sp.]